MEQTDDLRSLVVLIIQQKNPNRLPIVYKLAHRGRVTLTVLTASSLYLSQRPKTTLQLCRPLAAQLQETLNSHQHSFRRAKVIPTPPKSHLQPCPPAYLSCLQ